MNFVNKYQTKQQRKIKYHLCKSVGMDSTLARLFRDWRFTKLQEILLTTEMLRRFFHGDKRNV